MLYYFNIKIIYKYVCVARYKYILNYTYWYFFLKLLYTSLERIVDKPIDDTMQQVYSSSFTAKNDTAENVAIFDRRHTLRKFVLGWV